MKRQRHVIFLLILFLALFTPRSARADAAPPLLPPGSNPKPGSETKVRMMAETVMIAVSASDPPTAHVTANFVMRNLGNETENLKGIRFPYSQESYNSSLEVYKIRLENFDVQINGRSVGYRTASGYDLQEALGPNYSVDEWALFDVSFSPGRDVFMKISYDVTGTRWQGPAYRFDYVLSTGAGWNGTIGSAEIILRLPYEPNAMNVLDIPPSGVTSGREIHWQYNELEPTFQDNIEIRIADPNLWIQTIIERENISLNPNDGEAWGRLGKAYKDLLFFDRGYPRIDEGGLQLFEQSNEAYSKAVKLKPSDALWHFGYADLLIKYALSSSVAEEGVLYTGLQELNAAYVLAPDNDTIKSFLDGFSGIDRVGIKANNNGTYSLLWLTQTPTPDLSATPYPTFPPPTPTHTPQPTWTRRPDATIAPTLTDISVSDLSTLVANTPTPTPSSSSGNPVCGGAALLPMGLMFILLRKRRTL